MNPYYPPFHDIEDWISQVCSRAPRTRGRQPPPLNAPARAPSARGSGRPAYSSTGPQVIRHGCPTMSVSGWHPRPMLCEPHAPTPGVGRIPRFVNCFQAATLQDTDALIDGLTCSVEPTAAAAVARPIRYNLAALKARLDAAGIGHDRGLTSDGISMGEQDRVTAAVEALGRLALRRLAIRPGRRIALGQVVDKLLSRLPGNPVAVHVALLFVMRPLLARPGGLTETPASWPVRRVRVPEVAGSARSRAGQPRARHRRRPRGEQAPARRGRCAHIPDGERWPRRTSRRHDNGRPGRYAHRLSARASLVGMTGPFGRTCVSRSDSSADLAIRPVPFPRTSPGA